MLNDDGVASSGRYGHYQAVASKVVRDLYLTTFSYRRFAVE